MCPPYSKLIDFIKVYVYINENKGMIKNYKLKINYRYIQRQQI